MSAQDVAATSALLGRTVGGKFLIDSFLGEGAMGAVFKARQLALDKVVAIKVMHADTAQDELFVTRFKREAKAASRLDHPNSMRVIDFGEDDGLLYIAMEFVDGVDLFRLLKTQWPLSRARVIEIMMQSLAALAVAHDMGVIHRDLKPENIMVVAASDDEGNHRDHVKVCDFGIAKIDSRSTHESGAKLSTKGLVVGTPEYMSPEQGKGEPLDGRTDLYSVGVILFQLLTGRVPFEAQTALGVVLKHVTEAPPLPSSLNPDVDPQLEAICLKAMEKKREDRYANAREMRADFKALLDNGILSAPLLLGTRSVNDAMASAPTLSASASQVMFALSPSKITPAAVEAFDDAPAAGVPRSPGLVAALVVVIGLGATLAGAYFGVVRPMSKAPAGPDASLALLVADSAVPTVAAAPAPLAPPIGSASQRPASSRSAVVAPVPLAPPSGSAPQPRLSGLSTATASPLDPSAARVTYQIVGPTAVRPGAVSLLFDELNPSGCYQRSLKSGKDALEGKGSLRLDTDDVGAITVASYSGATIPEAALSCIVQGLKGRVLADVKVASTVTVALRFSLK